MTSEHLHLLPVVQVKSCYNGFKLLLGRLDFEVP